MNHHHHLLHYGPLLLCSKQGRLVLLVLVVLLSLLSSPVRAWQTTTRSWSLLSWQGRQYQQQRFSSSSSTVLSLSTKTDDRYYDSYLSVDSAVSSTPSSSSSSSSSSSTQQRITLTRYLDDLVLANPEMTDMVSLLHAVKMACKTISNLVHRAGLNNPLTQGQQSQSNDNDYTDGRFYSMRRLDQLSTIVLKNALRYTGKCKVSTPTSSSHPHHSHEKPSDHQPGVLIAKSIDSEYVACLDPLDGSGNADASICTGTVFGVFEKEQQTDESSTSTTGSRSSDNDDELVQSVLQPAENMRAAGYCLYSSATVLVFTFGPGTGVQGFTLDPQVQEFVLTHANITIPARGTVYSCNEANSEGWNDLQFKEYLRRLKTGQNQSKKSYAHRYVGSMVGDVHRTLLYGGIFAYPSDSGAHPQGNLQLLYKTAPLAFVVSTAGGRAIQAPYANLLTVRPERVHQKSPCFLGSPEDVAELESLYPKPPQA